MKGQSHLTIASDPLDWKLAPPTMYGLCGAEVNNPVAVDTFTPALGRAPDFDPFTTCAKCVQIALEKPIFTDTDAHGDSEPVRFYIYALADKKEVQAHEQKHRGETITELENTVSRVGVTKTPS